MKKTINWGVLISVLLVLPHSIMAQDLTFFHLDKSNGLSDNVVMSALTDKNGLLWIGTQNGLNSYDGYTVKNFFSANHPGLQNDRIVRMVCDDKNRIWIQCDNGKLTLLDEKRQFHAIDLTESNKSIGVEYLLPVSGKPMFLSGGLIYGLQDDATLHFARIEMKDEPLLNYKFERINKWDEDKLVFSGSDLLFLFDVKKFRVTATAEVPEIIAAARLTEDLAIVTSSSHNKLYKVSFTSGKVSQQYPDLKDQYGEFFHRNPGSIMPLQGQQFLITSPSAGIYVFDAKNETLVRYQHDVFDNRTISTNHTSYIFLENDGFCFIGTYGMGLSYFKRNSRLAKVKTIFEDKTAGKVYSGHINSIAEDSKGNIWMGASNTLVEWNRATGETIFHTPGKSHQLDKWGRIRTFYIDKLDRLWVGFSNGIVVFNKDLQVIAQLNEESGLPDNTINKITESHNGALWICTTKGIYFIDPGTFDIKKPGHDSSLKVVQEKNCNTIWFQSETEVWIGTWDGAYYINLSTGNLHVYTTENGLIFNEVIGYAGDDMGNVYIGTRLGFHILEPGKPLRSFKNVNNTLMLDCYSLLKDPKGNIWFASNDYLASYSPITKNFKVFDEKAGINNSGFRFYAALATSDGELIFGSNKGITYFRPESIHVPDIPLSVFIYEMETLDSTYLYIPESRIELPFYTNAVSFSFSAIDLLRGKSVFYQYQLDGIKKSWTKTYSGQRITYNNLQPGNYIFSVKASSDRVNWVSASNPVNFNIKMPWWRHPWFFASSLFFTGVIMVLMVKQRNKKKRQQKEHLETEQAINYLATSLHEQRTVEAILWDVAKNCIGRLQFEDCVIYLVDEERNVLVQKAAWGPKTTDENKIINPIEIPMGKGIVGSVAMGAKAEIIHDTSKDERYIIDDAKRHSEITVPIIYNGKVMGVIDSEHSRKGFFTRKHLSILVTVASLCANKMLRAKAEEEKHKAQMATLRHEREAVEARLKSLRLQMNPHFLFNSLNSIQQMILAGEDKNATMYLSKFSRLLRLVLLSSDKESIALKEELVTLNLYVELESLRFKESFHYDISCDEMIDPEEIKIPVMLIQPFVENAIWHGLLHKKGDRRLKIKFSEDRKENTVCIIEDNGIGREAAGKVNKDNHTQKGIAVAEERLKTNNGHHALKSRVSIQDLKDEFGNAIGTRVVLVLVN